MKHKSMTGYGGMDKYDKLLMSGGRDETYTPGSLRGHSLDLGLGDDSNLNRISASLNQQRLNSLLGKADPLDSLIKTTRAAYADPLDKLDGLGMMEPTPTPASPPPPPRLQQKKVVVQVNTTQQLTAMTKLTDRIAKMEQTMQQMLDAQPRLIKTQVKAAVAKTMRKMRSRMGKDVMNRFGVGGDEDLGMAKTDDDDDAVDADSEDAGMDQQPKQKQNVMSALAETIRMLKKRRHKSRNDPVGGGSRFMGVSEYTADDADNYADDDSASEF